MQKKSSVLIKPVWRNYYGLRDVKFKFSKQLKYHVCFRCSSCRLTTLTSSFCSSNWPHQPSTRVSLVHCDGRLSLAGRRNLWHNSVLLRNCLSEHSEFLFVSLWVPLFFWKGSATKTSCVSVRPLCRGLGPNCSQFCWRPLEGWRSSLPVKRRLIVQFWILEKEMNANEHLLIGVLTAFSFCNCVNEVGADLFMTQQKIEDIDELK